ncbi:hypothetical protein V6Z88_003745 [Aspergillus fumigatus]
MGGVTIRISDVELSGNVSVGIEVDGKELVAVKEGVVVEEGSGDEGIGRDLGCLSVGEDGRSDSSTLSKHSRVSSGGRASPFPSIRWDEDVERLVGCGGQGEEEEFVGMRTRKSRVGGTRDVDMGVVVDGKKGKGRRIVFSKDAVRSNWRYYLFT